MKSEPLEFVRPIEVALESEIAYHKEKVERLEQCIDALNTRRDRRLEIIKALEDRNQ